MVRNVGGNPCANILPHADFKGFYRVTYNESGMFTTLLKSFLSFIARAKLAKRQLMSEEFVARKRLETK